MAHLQVWSFSRYVCSEMFPTLSYKTLYFSVTFIFMSANAFSMHWSKIL